MPGLIEQVIHLGLEREDLRKDHPKALIGGARIPYPPKDMAALVSILAPRRVRSLLALERHTDGAVSFLVEKLEIQEVTRLEDMDAKGMRAFLRAFKTPVDLVTLDGRGLPLDAETIWKYILGGRESYAKKFGKGAPMDGGVPKLKPGASLIVNLADPGSREVWYRARARFSQSYQSSFVGMAHAKTH